MTQRSYDKNYRTGLQTEIPTLKMHFSVTPAERLQQQAPGTSLIPGRLSALHFCRGVATRVPPAKHSLLKNITYSINTRTPLSHFSVITSWEVLTVGHHTEEP